MRKYLADMRFYDYLYKVKQKHNFCIFRVVRPSSDTRLYIMLHCLFFSKVLLYIIKRHQKIKHQPNVKNRDNPKIKPVD
jgi:hypothetical protein